MSSADTSDDAGQFSTTKFAILWAFLVVLGYCAMVSYSFDGLVGPAVSVRSPAATNCSALVSCRPNELTLITFLHPQCPCSTATVSELTTLLSKKNLASNLKAYAVISRPSSCSDDFVQGAIYDSVASIKGVEVVIDRGDLESQRFGAKVSGQTLLFDGQGKCLFSGGITSARGEVGANAGALALGQQVIGNHAEITTANTNTINTTNITATPVFGCSLESSH
ncbi:RedB [soil metagenome]